ncbi:DUF3606 domain-containing protein [Luteibacter anthropi]|uniref:DUF3606 domain-containing protein n=1 Tax=Luteibacter anthropi TaxID=564369 RepID=A0A7X5ZIU3_9GAMM|nr:DUF3606 domain-containing protein [Luteibacter anthropi]NII07278.1 DUF3606 domain-containing protein [Luteibacter anthropi]
MNVVGINTTDLSKIRIDINQATDLRYWMRNLGVTAHELCLAVAAAGDVPTDVRAEIRRRRRMFAPDRA